MYGRCPFLQTLALLVILLHFLSGLYFQKVEISSFSLVSENIYSEMMLSIPITTQKYKSKLSLYFSKIVSHDYFLFWSFVTFLMFTVYSQFKVTSIASDYLVGLDSSWI